MSQENLIDMKDPVLLTHQPMHNVLFLIQNEYNTLTKAPPATKLLPTSAMKSQSHTLHPQ